MYIPGTNMTDKCPVVQQFRTTDNYTSEYTFNRYSFSKPNNWSSLKLSEVPIECVETNQDAET